MSGFELIFSPLLLVCVAKGSVLPHFKVHKCNAPNLVGKSSYVIAIISSSLELDSDVAETHQGGGLLRKWMCFKI